MRTAIYHPNLSLFGGGETVALTIANILSEKDEVDIFTPHDVKKDDLERFYNLDLKKISIVRFKSIWSYSPVQSIIPSMLLRSMYNVLNKYDLVIDTCTNGWFEKKLKAKTICYVHFPYFEKRRAGLKSIVNPFLIQPDKAFNYDLILCNSNFTKSIAKKLTARPLEVLYPPVKVEDISPNKKKFDRIVTIGRFTHEKKHEVMIEAFKELCKKAPNYEFHLIGSFQEGTTLYDKNYLDMLREISKGYKINFHTNMPHDKVLRFLEESKIYWHARGYGESDPNEYENFGIATVEAMAAGCIPVVINLGAQPEIVENGKSGFVWEKPQDLIKITLRTVNSKSLMTSLNKRILIRSKKFNMSVFRDALQKKINSLF